MQPSKASKQKTFLSSPPKARAPLPSCSLAEMGSARLTNDAGGPYNPCAKDLLVV